MYIVRLSVRYRGSAFFLLKDFIQINSVLMGPCLTVFGALGKTSKITVTGHVKCSCVLEAKVQIAAGDDTVVH